MLTRHLRADGLGKYEKNRTDMFCVLEDRMRAAIANAERLEESNVGRAPADSNPVLQFICSLRSLCPIWVLESRVKGVE